MAKVRTERPRSADREFASVSDHAALGGGRPKALLICYCCGVGEGSEAGAGWSWAKAASEVADVTLVTSGAHRDRIEKIEQAVSEFGLPIVIRTVGRESSSELLNNNGVVGRVMYCLWQYRAARVVRRCESLQRIDVVHHVTFASDSLPSAMSASKAPIRVWGPVGGTTRTNRGLYKYMTFGGVVDAIVRDVSNSVFRAMFGVRVGRHASLVVALNEDVERRWRREPVPVIVESNTALDQKDLVFLEEPTPRPVAGTPRVALFVGRLIPWKGLMLAVESLRYAPDWKLIVLGEGPDRAHAEALAARTGVSGRLEFRGLVPRTEVLRAFRSADALLFPSFHDSAPWAVGEATALGCPVVCLDVGGSAIQAGHNAHVVAVEPVGTLPQRLGERLQTLESQRKPDEHLLLDRIPSLLRTWYTRSNENTAVGAR